MDSAFEAGLDKALTSLRAACLAEHARALQRRDGTEIPASWVSQPESFQRQESTNSQSELKFPFLSQIMQDQPVPNDAVGQKHLPKSCLEGQHSKKKKGVGVSWATAKIAEESAVPPGQAAVVTAEPPQAAQPQLSPSPTGSPLLPGGVPETLPGEQEQLPQSQDATVAQHSDEGKAAPDAAKAEAKTKRKRKICFSGDTDEQRDVASEDPFATACAPALVAMEGSTPSLPEGEDQVSNEEVDEDEPEICRYLLVESWIQKEDNMKKMKAQRSDSKISIGGDTEDLQLDTLYEEDTKWSRGLTRLMIHPDSIMHSLWTKLGLVLFAWDAIVAPLTTFPLGDIEFLQYMNWVVRCYMTLDFVACFITGYQYTDVVVDMRVSKVARRYAHSWMLFDLPIMVLAWCEVFAVGAQDQGAVARLARLVRLIRVSRGVKLVKTLKIPDWLKVVSYAPTEGITIMFGMLKIIIILVWYNHCLACFWYAAGSFVSEQDHNWVDDYGYRSESFWYTYTTCFHWSMSLFTGSMDIMPQNEVERTLCIVALVAAFMTSISIVSRTTTLMTQLQLVTADRDKAFKTLQHFLHTKQISKSLSMRIQSYARKAVDELSRKTQEHQVELLHLVSAPMIKELHYECHGPTLRQHPFLNFYDAVYGVSMRNICHSALSEVGLSSGDVLFSNGIFSEKPGMFFLNQGLCLYMLHDSVPHYVAKGEWLAEPNLWAIWQHHGTLKARTDCTFTFLDAQDFQTIVCQSMRLGSNPLDYARKYLQVLNELPFEEQSDLRVLGFDIRQAADKALGHDDGAAHLTSRGSVLERAGLAANSNASHSNRVRKSFFGLSPV